MRCNTCIAPCLLLLLSAVGGASALGLLPGNNGGGTGCGSFQPALPAPTGGGLGCILPLSAREARQPWPSSMPTCGASKARIGRYRTATSGHVLSAASSDNDDDSSSSSTPRAGGRPKVSDEEMEGRKEQLRLLLCATKAEIDKLVRNNPSVLSRRDIVKSHGPKVAMLQDRLGISQKEAGKLCLEAARLLTTASSFETLDAKIDWLQARLDVDKAQLVKVIKRSRGILTVSRDKILEVQDWMAERLGLGEAKIAQMCRNHPGILTRKTSTLEEKVNWLQQALSLSDAEVRELFGKHPALFQYSSENLEPKLRFLRVTFELDDEGLKDLVMKCPGLCSRSEKNIEEKVKFYSELVGEREAKRLVIKSSNLLVGAVSLDNRLKPRLSQIQNAGTKVVWTEKLIRRLALRPDDVWDRYGLGEAPKGRRRSSD